MGVNWRTAAEETDVCDRFNLMPCIGSDEDCIAGAYLAHLTIDLHHPLPLEHEIDFLTQLVVVSLGFTCGWQTRFGQALFFDRCIGGIENTADGGPIGGGKGLLFTKLIDDHAG